MPTVPNKGDEFVSGVDVYEITKITWWNQISSKDIYVTVSLLRIKGINDHLKQNDKFIETEN